jgi:hypothetical protein
MVRGYRSLHLWQGGRKRHRDSGEQERVKISELLGKLLPLVS